MRKKVLVIVALLGLSALVAVAAFLVLYQTFLTTPAAPPATVEFTIERGDSFKKVAQQLHRRKVISNLFYFELLTRQEQAAGRIQAGDYLFEKPATPQEVLKRLVEGDILLNRLTLPEGLTVREIARKMAGEKLSTEEEITGLAFNSEFVHALGVEAESLEGYLFPETYSFPKKTSAKQFPQNDGRNVQGQADP